MDQSFSTQNLDHLGIVAGVCQEIDLFGIVINIGEVGLFWRLTPLMMMKSVTWFLTKYYLRCGR